MSMWMRVSYKVFVELPEIRKLFLNGFIVAIWSIRGCPLGGGPTPGSLIIIIVGWLGYGGISICVHRKVTW